MKRTIKRLTVLLVCFLINQTPASFAQESTFHVGLRIQKAASFYYENGVTVLYSDDRLYADRLFFGFSYISSRFGSAISSNAIKQDTFFLSAAWYWRKASSIRPFGQVNIGFFRADYEEEIFDVLPNTSITFSPEIGIGYDSSIPLRIALSIGYNVTSGTGDNGPGTLYPVFWQMTATWRLISR